MRKGARVDGGKVKINENGEVYIERRGRKPGPKSKRNSHLVSSDSIVTSGRRVSSRTLRKRSVSTKPLNPLVTITRRYASRRSQVFKSRCPTRSPFARAAICTKHHVVFNNVHFRTGDIVSVTDSEDGLPYFAQLRGFIADPYLQYFASLTWLAPKQSAPDPHIFIPEHFAHAVCDKKNYPIEKLQWVQSRPLLASYQKLWDLNRVVADNRRQEVINRFKALQQVAEVELHRYEEKPIVELSDAINELNAAATV